MFFSPLTSLPRDSSPPGLPRFPHLAQGPPQGIAAHLSSWGPLSFLACRFRATDEAVLVWPTGRSIEQPNTELQLKVESGCFTARWKTWPSWQRSVSIRFVWRADEHMEMCGVNLQGRLFSFPSDGRWAQQKDIPQTVAGKSRALNG